MSLKERFQNIRNTIDFYLRSQVRWGRNLPRGKPIKAIDAQIQREFKEFLNLFNWNLALSQVTLGPLVVADIGARNFALAPVIDQHFRSLGYQTVVHGIEIDAYRRFTDFHTRADYGYDFAKKIEHGYYHPVDFLTWQKPLHLAFLLNPFVSIEALLAWGLPISKLMPKEIFLHAYQLLKPQAGIVVLSNTSEEERTISFDIAKEVGFIFGEEHLWEPEDLTLQTPRYGVILYTVPQNPIKLDCL